MLDKMAKACSRAMEQPSVRRALEWACVAGSAAVALMGCGLVLLGAVAGSAKVIVVGAAAATVGVLVTFLGLASIGDQLKED